MSRDHRSSPGEDQLLLDDNLHVLQGLQDDSVDLVYIDPPFGTGVARRLDSIRLGQGEKHRTGFGGRSYAYSVRSSLQYDDSIFRVSGNEP